MKLNLLGDLVLKVIKGLGRESAGAFCCWCRRVVPQTHKDKTPLALSWLMSVEALKWSEEEERVAKDLRFL